GVLSGAELLGAAGALLDRQGGGGPPGVRVAPGTKGLEEGRAQPREVGAQVAGSAGGTNGANGAVEEEEESFDGPVARPGGGGSSAVKSGTGGTGAVGAPGQVEREASPAGGVSSGPVRSVKGTFPRARPEPLPELPVRRAE
ncbi:MAG: hypothetical protein ACT4PL_12425, partial [Phycisphaerales bacterium]